MKISISNIAWGKQFDSKILGALKKAGCEGLELAPGLLNFGEPGGAVAIQSLLDEVGLPIVGFHSLLFEHPELRIFKRADWDAIVACLDSRASLCHYLGGKFLVFGSPTARKIDFPLSGNPFSIATEFFKVVGKIGERHQVEFLIEPLYQADFIQNSIEGLDLVQAVANSCFGLQVDLRVLSTNKEPLAPTFRKIGSALRHVHTGGSDLSFIGPNDGIDHHLFAEHLHQISYNRFISLEMLRPDDRPDIPKLEEAIRFGKQFYCS
ncbi:MAG: sugar phosphate isomerase/epimerase [Candidatus Riflebacteria bacterium]|nr:sugar phosphate isomerase/epimerase [Candidatus Riflebacteria bacterium]